MASLNVTVWNEHVHERRDESVRAHYPDGIHGAIAEGLREMLGDDVNVRTATLEQDSNGLPPKILEKTDVLLWWSHIAQEDVADEIVDAIMDRVQRGMGFIGLHSATKSKIFRRLMGTTCCVRWRTERDRTYVWTVKPDHPIAAGLPEVFSIPNDEMYCEYFDIPEPEEMVFLNSHPTGEVLRNGLCYRRGFGRVFYFSAGDQEFPVYYHPLVRQVLANATEWARPEKGVFEGPYLSRNCKTGWIDEEVPYAKAASPLDGPDAGR